MNRRHYMRAALFAGAAILLQLAGGCMSPAARIKRHPDLFNSFPAEVQEKVSQGIIETGYTPDMVYIALGRPDRTYSRNVVSGADGKAKVSEVWSYTQVRWSVSSVPYHTSYWYRDHHGNRCRGSDWMWVDVEERTEYERMRVEFSDERVTAVEMLQR